MKVMLPVLVAAGVCLAGCVTITAAPGADRVRVTRETGDVANCSAVGNLPREGGFGSIGAQTPLRNFAVGLGGNAVLVTAESMGTILTGVVYRCP